MLSVKGDESDLEITGSFLKPSPVIHRHTVLTDTGLKVQIQILLSTARKLKSKWLTSIFVTPHPVHMFRNTFMFHCAKNGNNDLLYASVTTIFI